MFMSRNVQTLIPGFTDRRAERDRRAAARQQQAALRALEQHQPLVELSPDGGIIGVSPGFATLLGLVPDHAIGKKYHSLLVSSERGSPEARAFIGALSRGAPITTCLRHTGPDGPAVVLRLQTSPIPADGDSPARVVVLAADVTGFINLEQVSIDLRGQIAAIRKSQAVIEFSLDGQVLDANDNFLNALGYRLEEIKGQHHSMFVDPAERQTPEYRAFWDRLARGEFDAGQYKRIGKGGKEIWIQASYHPVLDADNKPFKVAAYATNISGAVHDLAIGLRARQSLDRISVAVMTVDRDFVVTGVNQPTRELLRKHQESFRKIWPGFEADRIVGMNIDTFHRDPRHQRKMLADESMLPHRTDITVGDLKFALNVSASHDAAGNYNGNILEWMDVTETRTQQGQLAAMDRSQAVIEFSLDGRILNANANFLSTLGYTLEEIRGQHHAIFVDPSIRGTPEYKAFWDKLGRGEFDAGVYKRIAKDGREVWIQANYNPILDQSGRAFKVVKYATDITAQTLRTADYEGQISAIRKSQAVIEFTPDGRILDANQNFLNVAGYTLDEVKGQHHSLFCEPAYRQSLEYKAFWEKLACGEFDAGQYKRIGKGGREVWLQASYNPILDASRRPFKVVKYATDVTERVLAEAALKRTVAETQTLVAAARDNDLSQRIDLDGKSGEIADLCNGLNGLMDTMSGMLGTISESCGTILVAAREIAMGNTDLSQRTEEQASSLEETSASLEELTATVRQNADNAQQANKLAASASEIATRGGMVVSEVVRTMDGITQSSRKISDIIGVIDEIAFQTNILALNAAVEAARAGEQGRGFAVVAAEVRSLAQRSANAAKEIKALISDSVEKVDGGSKLVASAGQTMDEIVTSVKRVTDIMAEISAASQEQSGGLDQVNTAVSQMDKITQQNAALVEEAAAAAKSMEEQTEGLQNLVAAFVLAPGGASVTPPPAAIRKPGGAQRKPATAARRREAQAVARTDDDWKEF